MISDFHIVIVTFNRAAYLEQCINSVLSQVGVSIFLHVIDNGSTDCTQNLLNQHRTSKRQTQSQLQVHTSFLRTNIDPLDAFLCCVSGFQGKIFTILGDDDWYSGTLTLFAVKNALLHGTYDSCLLNTRRINLSSPSLMKVNASTSEISPSISPTTKLTFTSRQILEKQCDDWKVKLQYAYPASVPSPCSSFPRGYRFHSSASFFCVESLESIPLTPFSFLTRPFGDIGMIQVLLDNHQHVLLPSQYVYIGVLPTRETGMIQNPFANTRLTCYLRASLDSKRSINLPIFSIIASNQFLRECTRLPFVVCVKRTAFFYLSAAKQIVFSELSFLTKCNFILRLFHFCFTDILDI